MRARRIFFRIILAGLVLISSFYIFLKSNQETEELSEADHARVPGKVVQLAQGVTHYFQGGSDSSGLVVFIHGGGITGLEVWENNLPFFIEKGYQVLAYDLYGRGYSERAQVDYTPELFRDQLSGLLDTLNVREPFHIVTMSMGAMIALDYTALHPEMVKKIVLIDPAATGDFKPNILLRIPLINSVLMTLYWYPSAVENQRKEFVDQELFNVYQERLKYFMNFSGYKYVNYSTWMHTLGQSKIHLLDSIKADSILLLYGEHDPYFPSGNVDVYTSHYPSLQHHAIEGAGHMPHLEKPAEVNSLIHSFLTD